MKLRSFSLIIFLAIGAASAVSYTKVKNHIKHKFRRKVEKIARIEAEKIERRMVNKYDILEWDQNYVDEFDANQTKEEAEIKDVENNRCLVDLHSAKNVAIK